MRPGAAVIGRLARSVLAGDILEWDASFPELLKRRQSTFRHESRLLPASAYESSDLSSSSTAVHCERPDSWHGSQNLAGSRQPLALCMPLRETCENSKLGPARMFSHQELTRASRAKDEHEQSAPRRFRSARLCCSLTRHTRTDDASFTSGHSEDLRAILQGPSMWPHRYAFR